MAHEDKQPRSEGVLGAPSRSWFGALTTTLGVVGTVLIVIMALAVNADIIGRNVFNRPIAGVTEFVGLSIVAVVFLQMANTLREGRHVSNDLIMAWVGRRHPRVALFFYGLYHLVGAFLMGLIVWYVVPILVENYAGNFYKGTAGIAEIPVWPFMLVVIIGGSAALIQYLLLAWVELRRVFGNAGHE